jgi:hypothetical protein
MFSNTGGLRRGKPDEMLVGRNRITALGVVWRTR